MNAHTVLVPALLSLSLVGCGAVVEPGTPDRTRLEVALPDDPELDGQEPVPSPLVVEPPRAATTAQSLFEMTFLTSAALSNVLRPDERIPADVVEQRIVTATDQEVQLEIELAPPTGTFSRVIVGGVIDLGRHVSTVLCESNNIATFDPKCETTRPATRELARDGAITTSKWTLWVLDEATSTRITSCVAAGADRVACVLPARAAASYKVIASAYGFEDLWDGSPGLGEQIRDAVQFTGAIPAQREYQCQDWSSTTNAFYCRVWNEYMRFYAVDRARLEFDPITLRITANGNTSAMTTPALTWDAGDARLPGDAS